MPKFICYARIRHLNGDVLFGKRADWAAASPDKKRNHEQWEVSLTKGWKRRTWDNHDEWEGAPKKKEGLIKKPYSTHWAREGDIVTMVYQERKLYFWVNGEALGRAY